MEIFKMAIKKLMIIKYPFTAYSLAFEDIHSFSRLHHPQIGSLIHSHSHIPISWPRLRGDFRSQTAN